MSVDLSVITDEFLPQVIKLGGSEFLAVSDHRVAAYPVRKALYEVRPRPLSLPAADFSHLDKLVRDALRPLLSTLEWPDGREQAPPNIVSLTESAAEAILRRDRLSEEQYEAFVGGFRGVGVVVPPHPSESSAGGRS